MNDLEQKRKRIETIVKVLGLGVAGALFAPFALMTIQGVVSLIVVAAIGLATVHIGIPWFAAMIANWRLKALKYAASLNPVETLENQYAQKKNALVGTRDNIKERLAVAADIFAQIQSYEQQFHRSSPFREKYTKTLALIEMSKVKYKAAQKNLVDFGEVIEEKRAEWRIAQSMAKADKLSNVGEDFVTKMMQDTALTTIQDSLNFAFAELDASLLDAESAKEISASKTETPEKTVASDITSLKMLTPPTDLDFDGKEISPKGMEISRANRSRIAVA